MEQIYDMIVIGGGPAGYTAALYAARSGLSVVVLEKLSAGGQMALTEQIDNYPGFEDGIDGFTLGEKMQQSAERFGAVTELAEVYKASLSGRIKTLDTSEGVFQSRTVVIATGASPRPLGVPGEESLVGKGVHYCAACDGAPYRGKTVAVVGGGNSAAADALALSRIAQKVYLIHRRDSLRATKVYHEPLMNAPNVEFCWNSTVSALLHESRLTGLRLKYVNTGAERALACDGVFISVGRAPATELFQGELALDKSGYIVADESTRTNLPGVFAVGDVRTKALRQVVTAVGDGAKAATALEKYAAAMQEKTGLRPRKPEIKETKAASDGESRPEGIFPRQVMQQLEAVFERMQEPLILELCLDEKAISEELRSYMEELAQLTPKLTVRKSTLSLIHI